jgi:hypothetical protein
MCRKGCYGTGSIVQSTDLPEVLANVPVTFRGSSNKTVTLIARQAATGVPVVLGSLQQ